LHEAYKIGEEWFASVFVVELIGLRWLSEFAHFKFRQAETAHINSIDDFTSLSVTVRLDHCKSSSGLFLKGLLSKYICIINQLKLSRVDVDIGTNEEFSG